MNKSSQNTKTDIQKSFEMKNQIQIEHLDLSQRVPTTIENSKRINIVNKTSLKH